MISQATLPEPAFGDSKCGLCTAICCSYFALEIDTPEEPEDFENLRWYILHEDVNLFVDDGVWYLQIFRKCTWLDGNKCGGYEERPSICREYSNDSCDYDGVQSDLVFRNIQELEAYRDEWVSEWEARRARRRATAHTSAARRRLSKVRKATQKARRKTNVAAQG